jgi:O-antigen ligase
MLKKYYKQIIFCGIIVTVIAAVLIGWSSREVVGRLFFVAASVILLGLHLLFGRDMQAKKAPWLLVLFLLGLLVVTSQSVYFFDSLLELGSFAAYFVIFWLAAHYIGRRQLKYLSWVLIGAGSAAALYGFADFLRLDNIEVGVASFMGWKNAYAGFLLLTIPLTLVGLWQAEKRWVKIFLISAGSLQLANLFFTNSQAAWLVLALVFLVQLFFYTRHLRLNIWSLFSKSLIIMVMAGLVVGAFLLIHFNKYPNPDPLADDSALVRIVSFLPTSAASRLIYWQHSLSMSQDNFWSGVGLGNFTTVYTHYFSAPWTYTASPHNYLLFLLTGSGIFATMVFFIFIAQFIVKIFKTKSDGREGAAYFYPLVFAWAAVLLHAMFDVTLEVPAIAWLWWLLAGALYGFAVGPSSLAQAKLQRVWLVGLFLALVVFLLPTLAGENYYLISQIKAKGINSAAERLELLEKAQRFIPWAATVHEALAVAHWDSILESSGGRIDHSEQAQRAAQRAYELNSQSAHQNWFLGLIYFYTRSKDDPAWTEIYGYAQRAIEYDLHDPSYYRLLAWAYLRQAQTDEALAVINQVLNLYTAEEKSRIIFGPQMSLYTSLEKDLRDLESLRSQLLDSLNTGG